MMTSSVAAVTMTAPSGKNCWTNTFNMLVSEVKLAISSSPLLQKQRTYVLCANTVFQVGLVDYGSLTPVGAGGYALIAINPNMHIKCQIPGTCTFKGSAAFLTNLENNNDVYTFVSDQGMSSLPSKYRVDSSNLLVEGLVFRGASDKSMNERGTVRLRGFGLNMQIKDCLWTRTDSSNPPYAGIDMFRSDDYGPTIQGGGKLQASLLLSDCTFRNNVFKYAVILVSDWYWWNDLTSPSHRITIANSVITDNVLKYYDHSESWNPYYSAILSLRASVCNLTNVVVKNNSMKRGRAAVVVVNSPSITAKKVNFGNNTIAVHQGLGCTDVARVKATRTEKGYQNIVFVDKDLGCTEFS